jgi:site-specific recombinase XerD
MYLAKNRKSGRWYIYFRQANGKKTRLSTKCKLKKDALKFLNDFERKVKAKNELPSITISEFAVQYLNTISITHTKQSYKLSKNSLEKFMEFVGTDKLLTDITHSQAETFILDIFQHAKHHAALQLRHLKASLNFAIERGYIQKNPFKGIKLRIPEKTPVFINVEELKLILVQENNPILRNIYQFAFYTGMRISEILNLTWGSVAQRSNVIKITNSEYFTTKSKRERIVPISNIVSGILLEMGLGYNNNPNDYIFTKDGEKFKTNYVSKQFKKCVRGAGLDESMHFHTLRHSFASHLVQKGASLFTVKELLGHKDFKTTQIYSHSSNQNLKDAISLLD